MSKLMTILFALAAGVAGLTAAQQPAGTATPTAPIKRILLQRFDVPNSNFETVTGIAELAPSVNIGRHTHPGLESGYVMDGEFTLLVEGKPPLALKAGDSYTVRPRFMYSITPPTTAAATPTDITLIAILFSVSARSFWLV